MTAWLAVSSAACASGIRHSLGMQQMLQEHWLCLVAAERPVPPPVDHAMVCNARMKGITMRHDLQGLHLLSRPP
jgi:hypothetical protein